MISSPALAGRLIALLYTEYNVGHFARQFTLSHMIDQQQIDAALNDGVLTLTLKKVEQARPRRMEISQWPGRLRRARRADGG
jgi:hypothetical protein